MHLYFKFIIFILQPLNDFNMIFQADRSQGLVTWRMKLPPSWENLLESLWRPFKVLIMQGNRQSNWTYSIVHMYSSTYVVPYIYRDIFFSFLLFWHLILGLCTVLNLDLFDRKIIALVELSHLIKWNYFFRCAWCNSLDGVESVCQKCETHVYLGV